jgi:glycosyltransferase involved in cell wall biosynthesis
VGTISTLICTRNRATSVVRAARSLLAEPGGPLELIVIDQSDGHETEEALRALGDPRLRYVRTDTRGKGKALNQGLALARGDILVCTDDDCIAPPGWPVAMASALEAEPSAALAFCRVVAVEHDHALGYVPQFLPHRTRVLYHLGEVRTGHGLGAGMALRRYQVAEKLGGFDEMVGPGSRFPSGDDWDLIHRALLRGLPVLYISSLAVLHDGFRSFAEGRAHTRRDWLAIGAVCAKPLRAGHLSAAVVPLWEFFRNAVGPAIYATVTKGRPTGFTRISAFVEGFYAGLTTPVDRQRLLFLPPKPHDKA